MEKNNQSKIAKFFDSTLAFAIMSILLGIVAGAVVLLIAGYHPLKAYWVMLEGIISKPKYIMYTINKATPLIMTGFSVAFAFRAGLFNIGAEGQFIIGSLAAMLVGCLVELPFAIHAFVAILCGILAAGLWGGLSGYLKAKFGVHEVISTIMLNWIALYLNNFITMLPGIKNPNSEASKKILDSARIDILGTWKVSDIGLAWRDTHPFFNDLLKPDINIGILIAGILAIVMSYILNKTTLGYELRTVGFNKDAAEASGINVNRSFVISMGIAGAFAGIAGATHVLGVSHETTNLATSEGYGFDGIAVSLIGNNSSIGCFLAGLLFGALKYGGSKIQGVLGAPKEIINIVIGTIIFFIAMPKLMQLLIKIKRKRGTQK